MTDLISRTARGSSGTGGRSVPRPGAPAAPQRPLSTSAAIAGAVAAGISAVLCMSVALAGWFLADGGAHGNTTDALRVGADAWLVGLGSGVTASGLPLGIVPLSLTMILVTVAFRSGRWAGRDVAGVTDDRLLLGGVGIFATTYVVLASLTCVLASETAATPGLGRSVLGAGLVATLGGGAGLALETGRFEGWRDDVPEAVREVVTGAVIGALGLFAAGASLVAVALLGSFNEAASVLSNLNLSFGDALAFTTAMVLFAPNAALLGAAYLIGPGFAVGTGTSVASTGVTLGAVPAVPLLAALPAEGAPPGWLIGLLVVPALAAGWGVVRAHRDGEPLGFDVAAIRGAGSGVVAGLLITLAIGLAGGPMGTGRMSDIGAPVWAVLLISCGTMAMGGLLGALGQAWWQRRR